MIISKHQRWMLVPSPVVEGNHVHGCGWNGLPIMDNRLCSSLDPNEPWLMPALVEVVDLTNEAIGMYQFDSGHHPKHWYGIKQLSACVDDHAWAAPNSLKLRDDSAIEGSYRWYRDNYSLDPELVGVVAKANCYPLPSSAWLGDQAVAIVTELDRCIRTVRMSDLTLGLDQCLMCSSNCYCASPYYTDETPSGDDCECGMRKLEEAAIRWMLTAPPLDDALPLWARPLWRSAQERQRLNWAAIHDKEGEPWDSLWRQFSPWSARPSSVVPERVAQQRSAASSAD
jgi:hypothetical protein